MSKLPDTPLKLAFADLKVNTRAPKPGALVTAWESLLAEQDVPTGPVTVVSHAAPAEPQEG